MADCACENSMAKKNILSNPGRVYSNGNSKAIHPCTPLSSKEILDAVEIIRNLPNFNTTTRIVSVTLKEPHKKDIFESTETNKPLKEREAYVVLIDNIINTAYDYTINITTKQVISSAQAPPNSQPMITIDEMFECEAAVINSEEFKSALKKHYGVEDTSLVMVDIWSAGYYGEEEEKTMRLTRPLCFLRRDPTENGYAHPIEGIRPVVDLNTMTVIRVEDHGVWPLPPVTADYAANKMKDAFRTDLKPLEIKQPEGPSYTLTGNYISWQNFSLVIGFNAREGLTLHDIRFADKGKSRSILFRASLTEMVVPYGEPCMTQARKNAFDVGEYGIGSCTNSLRLGCDCVGHISYLDGHLVTSRGNVLTIPNAICIHEEDFGILWKHTDRRLPDAPEVRRSRRLVISAVATVENYEYGYFWYFYQDGNIQFEVKLTGILSLAAVRDNGKQKYGTMISPLLYAPNHQHFFNVRLDFAIDGIKNSVCQSDVVAEAADEVLNPFQNAFYASSKVLTTEKEARSHLKLETMRSWKIINPKNTNFCGDPVGYKFVHGDNSFPLAPPSAWWRKRAGFVDYHVWVTPFAAEERFAAGDFPNQSTGGEGLSKWVEQDRPIENTDVVFWYTFGHTHIPRPEDYPVMPAAYIGFLLKPVSFFDMNPSNDVPPTSTTF